MKLRILVASTVLAFISARQLAFAQPQVQSAEERVREFALKNGANSAEYADQLLSLACTYKKHGMAEKADSSYKKAIGILETSPDLKTKVPEKMMYWAGVLSLEASECQKNDGSRDKNKKADLLKAETIMSEAIKLYNQSNELSKQKCAAYLQEISFLQKRNKIENARQEEKKLDLQIASYEKKKSLSQDEIYLLASTLDQLSVFHTGFFSPVHKPQVSMKEVALSDYKRGESLRLRALALFDRLPDNNKRRQESHLVMSNWYDFFGKKEKAAEQLKIFKQLLAKA